MVGGFNGSTNTSDHSSSSGALSVLKVRGFKGSAMRFRPFTSVFYLSEQNYFCPSVVEITSSKEGRGFDSHRC